MKGEPMEKEQSIDLLDNLIGMIEDNQDNDYDAAFRMGIEALKQPEIIRCKDCRQYEWMSNRIPEEQTWHCHCWDADTGKDDFAVMRKGEPTDRIKVDRAIDGLTEWRKHVQTNSDIDRDISTAIEALREQLSQQGTEPHEGYWIDKGIFNNGLGISWHCWECSKCHSQKTSTSNYCPNCGAKMKGE